jgi:hypothetical protein
MKNSAEGNQRAQKRQAAEDLSSLIHTHALIYSRMVGAW